MHTGMLYGRGSREKGSSRWGAGGGGGELNVRGDLLAERSGLRKLDGDAECTMGVVCECFRSWEINCRKHASFASSVNVRRTNRCDEEVRTS